MKPFIITAVCVALVFCGLFEIRDRVEMGYERERRETVYPAWCKFTGRTDLPYDQWKVLYQRGLLKSTGGAK